MITFHPYRLNRMTLVAVLVWIVAGCSSPALPTENPVRHADVAEFDQLITAKEFSGLVVVFASWCPPCREELPQIARLYRDQRPEGIQIVAMSLDEGDTHTVQRLINELRTPFPVYQVGMQASAHYRIIGVPTVMIVDQGRILEKLPGRHPASTLAAKLKGLG